MLISIIVPCYNEQEVLPLFYDEITRVFGLLPEYSFEVVMVNDGSRDQTLSVMKELAKEDGRFKYISFSRNFGKEAAMYAGLDYSGGELVTLMDSDLQDPPALLPEMIGYIVNDGFDSVALRRVTRKGEPRLRSFFAQWFYRLINRMSDVEIVDGARDYRLMTRTMTDAILSMAETHRFTKGICSWVGFDTKWLEYENRERAAGETKWSFWKLFVYAVEGIVGYTTVPLRLVTVSGLFFSLLAFLYLGYTLAKNLLFGVDLRGYPSTLAFMLMMGGIIMLALGIIGEYLAKTYMETKKRPIYIAKESNMEKPKKQ